MGVVARGILGLLLLLSLHEELYSTTPERLGGDGSHSVHGPMAFELHFPNISPRLRAEFQSGNSFFEQNWVAAPSSTKARSGLGPLFNARSCSSCHFKDGRGSADLEQGLLLKLNRWDPESSETLPSQAYGPQFQNQSLGVASAPQVQPEGSVTIEWEYHEIIYPDGSKRELRKPTYQFSNLQHGPMEGDIRISARLAPQLIGLGLVEAISEKDLVAEAQRQSEDPDVSGKLGEDSEFGIGRFGWRASQPSLKHQSAAAFRNDMGLSNELFTEENCEKGQKDCLAAAHTAEPYEVNSKTLTRIDTYLKYLAVPTRRVDELSLAGEEIFNQVGCQNCHRKTWVTSGDDDIEEPLRNQVITPYSDFLLHDMGQELADQGADASEEVFHEWRTPPLWGLGLAKQVNPDTTFLHDGRARGLEEAILWHGGEATNSKEKFMQLPSKNREALLHFLRSL